MKLPLHVSEIPGDTWYAGTDREIRGRALCDVGGRAKVGVGYLELPPGSHTGPGPTGTRGKKTISTSSPAKTRCISATAASRSGPAAMSASPPASLPRIISRTPAASPSPTS